MGVCDFFFPSGEPRYFTFKGTISSSSYPQLKKQKQKNEIPV